MSDIVGMGAIALGFAGVCTGVPFAVVAMILGGISLLSHKHSGKKFQLARIKNRVQSYRRA